MNDVEIFFEVMNPLSWCILIHIISLLASYILIRWETILSQNKDYKGFMDIHSIRDFYCAVFVMFCPIINFIGCFIIVFYLIRFYNKPLWKTLLE